MKANRVPSTGTEADRLRNCILVMVAQASRVMTEAMLVHLCTSALLSQNVLQTFI
jgi:hypothetical protein